MAMLPRNQAKAVKNHMAPPKDIPSQASQVPPPGSEDHSFYTALTQPATQAVDDNYEDEQKEPDNPFKQIWGRLIPCNASSDPVDLDFQKLEFWMGRNRENDVVCTHPKISESF